MNFELEMKLCFALRMLFALQNYWYSFRHVCGIMGQMFSDMYGFMGPNFFNQNGTSTFKIRLS